MHSRPTYINMPDTLVDIIGPRAGAKLSGFATTQDLVPMMVLEVPNGAGEKAGGDEIQ